MENSHELRLMGMLSRTKMCLGAEELLFVNVSELKIVLEARTLLDINNINGTIQKIGKIKVFALNYHFTLLKGSEMNDKKRESTNM